MKRVGYLLFFAVALLVVFTLALAQLEAKSAKNLIRTLTGEDERGYYGSAVEGAYAFTGGAPLFAISATGENKGPTRNGKVFLYDNLHADEPLLTLAGPTEGEIFGMAMSGGGDWNGDGLPDLAVGAPGPREGDQGIAGNVYVYLGGAEFGKAMPSAVSASEVGDGFGEAISLKQDINGDSLADLIIGAPRSRKAGATAGRAYVWFGKKAGSLNKSPDVEIKLGTTNDFLGSAIATGDLNGDGQPDLAIGAPYHNIGDKTPGSVFVFFGGKTVNLNTASQIISGDASGFQDRFGRAVAIVDDQNGDRAAELLIGAPQYPKNGKQVGQVFLFNGGQRIASTPARVFTGVDEAGRFGERVFAVGDLNKDGKGDFAVQCENELQSRGAVRFYYGGWEKDFYHFAGEAVADRLGNAMAALGDLDKNGTPEVIVGARWNDAAAENVGRAYILSFE